MMGYGRIVNTLCALAAFLLVAWHLGERLCAVKTISDPYSELVEDRKSVIPGLEKVGSNGDSKRMRYLLGVGKADVTG